MFEYFLIKCLPAHCCLLIDFKKQPLSLKIYRFRPMKSGLMASSKKFKSDVRSFREFWTTDFAFVSRDNQAVWALCCQNVVCRSLSTKRHFETKRERSIKDNAEKIEFLKKAVSRYEKQSSIFKKVIRSTNQTMEGSYKVAEGTAKHEKPFTDGVFVKVTFLSGTEVLFDHLPNKCTIISRIKDSLFLLEQ